MRLSRTILGHTLILAAAAAMAAPGEGVAAPASVVLTGDLQSELGCSGDFVPDCGSSALKYDPTDRVWQGTFALPVGDFRYFVALDGNFDVTYGAHGRNSLHPIGLTLASPRPVKFYYDDETHWLTDNVTTPIATLAGDLQSELGCNGDFQPDCLRSWLQDIDGDGIYTLDAVLPAGSYSTIVTIGESFDERYGAGGKRNGANIDFVSSGDSVAFCYDGRTHVLSIGPACEDLGAPGGAVPEPSSAALLASAAGFCIASLWRRRRRPKA